MYQTDTSFEQTSCEGPFEALISKFTISFVVPVHFSPMDEVAGTRSCETVSKNTTCFISLPHCFLTL